MLSAQIRALRLAAKLQTQSKETFKALRPVKQIYRHLLNAVVLYSVYKGYPRRSVQDFWRVFLMLKYTDMTQNTYIQI